MAAATDTTIGGDTPAMETGSGETCHMVFGGGGTGPMISGDGGMCPMLAMTLGCAGGETSHMLISKKRVTKQSDVHFLHEGVLCILSNVKRGCSIMYLFSTSNGRHGPRSWYHIMHRIAGYVL